MSVPQRFPLVVTFDLFSALLDSRAGGSAAFATLARERGWSASGPDLYDAWDPRNKAAQRDAATGSATGASWRATAAEALRGACAVLDLDTDEDRVVEDVEHLVASMPAWPLWPDVADGLPALGREHRVGLLSNVDDDVFARTAAAALVDPEVAFTSQRLGACKPHPEIYLHAVEAARPLGRLVHVATSARDVRGALEAGIVVVRLARRGHEVDPAGPAPAHEVTRLADLADVLSELRGTDPGGGDR